MHLPLNDNEGNPLRAVHEELAKALVEEFGGATVEQGTGLWAHAGKLYREHVMVYRVAMADSPAHRRRWLRLAEEFGGYARQLQVYAVTSDGVVHFVEVPQDQREAA